MLAAAVLLALSGCAVRRELRPDGTEITEIAAGPKARIERCTDAPPELVAKGKARICDEVSSGWFSPGFAGVLEAGVTALGAMFATGVIP